MQHTFFAILSLLLATTSVCAGESDQVPLQDGDIEAVVTPVVDNFNTPTKASEQFLVTTMPTPSFYYGFTQCNCDGASRNLSH